MKMTVRKVVRFECKICRTKYNTAAKAIRCERKPIEVRTFSIGDLVANIEPRTCNKQEKNYIFEGKVVKIIGPMAADYEYEAKWLGCLPDRIHSHVFEYQVRYKCPHCKKMKEARYYAPELKKVNR